MDSKGGLYRDIMSIYNNQLQCYTLNTQINYSEKYRSEVYEWIKPVPVTYANESSCSATAAAKSILNKNVHIIFLMTLNELQNRHKSVATKFG